MKAICPKCSHVMYWFDDADPTKAPEHLTAIGLAVHCEYDGRECVSAPGNEEMHNCYNCRRRGILNAHVADEAALGELMS